MVETTPALLRAVAGVAPERRLIEVAFPQEEASIDSVQEKNVRHGHISTLHIWPARRPLAASRAALIAMQDLADQIGEIKKATIDYDLTLRVRVELGGSPSPEVVEAVNALLREVSERLNLS